MADSPFDAFSGHADDPFAEHAGQGSAPAPAADHEEEEEEEEEEDEVHVDAASTTNTSSATLDDDPFAAVHSSTSSSSAPSLDPLGDVSTEQKTTFGSLPEPVEDSAYTAWEKDRAKILSDRQLKAEETKRELLTQAREDLQKFYADLETRISKTQKQNRIDEKNYKADLAALMAHGTKWEKAAKFANLTSRQSDKSGSVSRVDRMRKLLITLKAQKEEQKS